MNMNDMNKVQLRKIRKHIKKVVSSEAYASMLAQAVEWHGRGTTATIQIGHIMHRPQGRCIRIVELTNKKEIFSSSDDDVKNITIGGQRYNWKITNTGTDVPGYPAFSCWNQHMYDNGFTPIEL